FGLPIVREERARTADEAAAIAKKFRVPVVVKIDSPDLPHKTDVGGVILGVATPADAAAAFDRTSESVRHKASHAQIKGVLIAEMLRDGTELIIGMKRDSSFGPVVLLGLGGIFVEVLHAFTLRCAPFGIATARQMIAELPGHDILRGARGAEPRDVDALARFLVDFSRFAAASADLVREIDLNPVFVRPAGQGVVIADALMVI
ncbi:MAG: CoA-binding protein, partial [Alphaproteobacteria bacterium]|nr:CoA-binding protein [Alphaproteobacteria bacterium]